MAIEVIIDEQEESFPNKIKEEEFEEIVIEDQATMTKTTFLHTYFSITIISFCGRDLYSFKKENKSETSSGNQVEGAIVAGASPRVIHQNFIRVIQRPAMSKYVLREISILLDNVINFWTKNENETSDSWATWKGPNFKSILRNGNIWLENRRNDEGAENLWRVHDKLYDLTDWIDRHPGGSEWIKATKGTDITEAFESHHITTAAYSILNKYYVRDASTPRNSPFTFKPDGFYNKLKEKVKIELSKVPTGPTIQSLIMMDSLAFSAIFLSVLAAANQSFILATLAALFLTANTVCAHNFFHQKDSWRMFYFTLSGLSVRDWRISHAMSHHLFPNTKHDLEIMMFEPFLMWLPKPNKTFINRFVSWIYSPVVYVFIFHAQLIPRILFSPDGISELVVLIIPTSMVVIGGVTLLNALLWWNIVLLTSSFFFGVVGLNAAHHHPELFHDGDEAREVDLDWGLHQLDTVRDRVEIKGNLPLTLVLFGEHSLHHLFPTVDHSHLHKLYPALEETCKEFGIVFKTGSVWDLIRGQFLQLARIDRISFKTK